MSNEFDKTELPGFPGYLVRKDGQIESKRSGRVLRASFKSPTSRVLCVTIRNKTISIAAEVASAFLGSRPQGFILGYKDGNPSNCAADNLEWIPTQATLAESLSMSARTFRRRLTGN